MPVTVLGISALYHDSAAAIVRDGSIVAAAQEERFSRKKHDPRFPSAAINYCLEEAYIEPDELDCVVFYDNTMLSTDRVLQGFLGLGEDADQASARNQWVKAASSLLGIKAHLTRLIQTALNHPVPVLYSQHHMSHAASAFYPSPFEEAAILTIDGVGEWATTTLGRGSTGGVELLREIRFPHSLGLLYSAFTYYCGFKVNSGEYKLMGLAPYGEPVYADVIRKELVDVKSDGSFRLNTQYFGFLDSDRMTNDRFHALFDGPPRMPESRITRREMDVAASIQAVTEELVLGLARHAHRLTQSRYLVMAGGVALNCVANGRVLRDGPFDDIWIQPAAGDAGGALGAALLASYEHFGVTGRLRQGSNAQAGSYLGPRFSSREVRAFLDAHGYPYEVIPDIGERSRRIADALQEASIVGYFNGRMEFGPRALGSRSILGDARNPETQLVINLKIKNRESFRPFAPAVLAERITEYFEIDRESPFMLLVAPVREERRVDVPDAPASVDAVEEDLLEVIRKPRSDIPAVTHIDFSARIQSVNCADHPDFHAVIKAFEKATGCAVVVNTSFNVRGEPIVCTPRDAYQCFMQTDMDVLVMEDCYLLKSAQPVIDYETRSDRYELD